MEETSNVFSFEGVKFVMNLKADEIINRKFYKESGEDVSDALKGGQRIAYQTGSYTDYEGKEHPFETGIYLLDGICFTVMDTDCMEFLSSGNHVQAVQTAAEMLKIARTVQVDENDVITAFSSRQTIVNNRKKLELFQNIAPESGMIQELFENEEYLKTGNEIFGDNYDTTLNTPEPEPEEITEGTIVGDELFQGEYSELFEDDEVSEDSEKNP